MDVDARIEALQEQIARLNERIAQLEAHLGMHFIAPLELGLTPHESRLLGMLLTREVATKDALMAGIYRDQGKEEPEIKIVDVFVCKIRKKLAPFGIEIETVWGTGYRMPAASKALMREMFSDRVAA